MGDTYLGAAHGEDPLGQCPQVDTELGDAHKGTAVPGISLRGDAHGGSPGMPTRDVHARRGPLRMPARRTGLKAARGQDLHLRGPTGASVGRNHQEKGKGERRARQAEAAARRLRTCGPGATREGRADREDLEDGQLPPPPAAAELISPRCAGCCAPRKEPLEQRVELRVLLSSATRLSHFKG
ncbi:unnamed protein product [Coccothraustes coccothraustes]